MSDDLTARLANLTPKQRELLLKKLRSKQSADKKQQAITPQQRQGNMVPATDSQFQLWHQQYQQRLSQEGRGPEEIRAQMLSANPAVIPRNHRVEEALAAAESDDLRPFNELLVALRLPFERTESLARFREPGPAGACYRTFCGT